MTTQIFGDRVDRWLLKKGFRAQRPLSTLRLIEARRMFADPLGYARSLQKASTVTKGSRHTDYIPKDSGYRLFGPAEFPETVDVVRACLAVYSRHENELTAEKKVNKRYFYNILTEQDLRDHPVLIDFALSKAVSEIATGYLGQVPRLASLGVFYSEINDTIGGSQLFHVDGDALTQVKCFVNIWDVGEGGGAFTFLRKGDTSNALRNGGLLKTVSDADLDRVAPKAEKIVAVGAAGSGVFVDTSRCLHQGSRARLRARLVFQFQYVSRPDALLTRQSGTRVAGGHLNVSPEYLDGVSLGNPKAAMFVG